MYPTTKLLQNHSSWDADYIQIRHKLKVKVSMLHFHRRRFIAKFDLVITFALLPMQDENRYLTLFATRLIIYPTFNPFQLSVAFHIETSHLFCSAKQMNGFYIEHNTRLKWVNQKKMTERGSCIIHKKVDIWPGKWSTSK